MTFPIDQLPDGQWRVRVETVCGPQPIGMRLVQHDPASAPDLEDVFPTQAEAQKRSAEWSAYFAAKAKPRAKRGK